MPAAFNASGQAALSARAVQREDTRRRVLARARQLFRAKGVEPVSMEDIARAAAVSRATVYLHFAGKPALLRDLLVEDWERQVRLFERLGMIALADKAAVRGWVMQVADGMRLASDSFAIHRAALGQNDDLALRHKQQCRRLAEVLCRASGDRPASRIALARIIEAELIVAEIEHFATASVIGWTSRHTAAAIPLMVERIHGFAHRRS